MHFSVMLIHENDEESIMLKRSHDATEADGAELEFVIELTKKEAEKEYKAAIGKKGTYSKKDYPTIDDYIAGEYCYLTKNDEGDYGSTQNFDAMYDWYCVGGRWRGLLPTNESEEELTALVKSQLDLTDEIIKEKYRDNVSEFIKVSEMPLHEACTHLEIGSTNSLIIGEDDISAEDIINWIKKVTKNKGGDVLKSLIHSIIIEEDWDEELIKEGDDRICEKFFKKKFNYFLKKNKKEGTEFRITILDLHS